MTKLIDLTGARFARLVVQSRAPNNARGGSMWSCVCDCGRTKELWSQNLVRGRSQSCGCIRAELLAARNAVSKSTHGRSRSSEFGIWTGMKDRCLNPRSKDFRNYGGRGILVCERWLNFSAFLADMGPRPSAKHSIERVNNGRGYDPGNCVWAVAKTQCNNTRNSVRVTINGITQALAQWADAAGLARATMYSRYRVGVKGEALLAPARRGQERHSTN